MRCSSAILLAGSLLAGCGIVQVGERAIPSVAGAVATTAWQRQDVSQVTGEEAAALTSPEAYLAFVVTFAEEHSRPGEWRNGILSREGSEAVAYLQQLNSAPESDALANEARLTMTRQGDGTWTLAALETREVCRGPLINGACGDNSGGKDRPAPAPSGT